MKGRIMGGFPLVVALVALSIGSSVHAQKLQTDNIQLVTVINVVQPQHDFELKTYDYTVSLPAADYPLPVEKPVAERQNVIVYNTCAVTSPLPYDYGLRIRYDNLYSTDNFNNPVFDRQQNFLPTIRKLSVSESRVLLSPMI